MAILDQQGRLFGKISILDVGAIAVVAITLIGLFLVPSNTGNSIAQIVTAETKPVEVEIMIRGLTVTEPNNLIKVGDKPNIIIRNQPRGQVTVKAVKVLIPKIPVPKLDGTVSVVPDPRLEETYSRDFAITLGANAKITNDGVILESEKVKIGTPIEIETAKYIMRGSAMAVRY
jgi:Domain of unknown function (DUF4330)